jgi:hypothetical protein
MIFHVDRSGNTPLSTPIHFQSVILSDNSVPIPNPILAEATDGMYQMSAHKLGDLGRLPAPAGFGNFDGKCDYQDAALFRYAYVVAYNSLADFDQNGIVNYKDANMFRIYYLSDP